MTGKPIPPERILRFFFIILFMVAGTAGTFIGGLWGALGIAGGLISYAFFLFCRGALILPKKGIAILSLCALGVFAVELPFSSDLSLSVKIWGHLASIFLPLVLLMTPALQREAYAKSFIVYASLAAFLGALALGLELLSQGTFLHEFKSIAAPLTEYNRGISHLVLLAFPLCAGLWLSDGKKAAFVLGLCFLFPASLTESHTAKLALIVGTFCMICAAANPLWMHRLLILLCAFVMGWPFYAQLAFAMQSKESQSLHDSWRHRLEIWDYLAFRTEEHPWLGWGLGTTHTLDFKSPHGSLYRFAKEAAPHAHNFVVQLWVETGALGVLMGFAFLYFVLNGVMKLDRKLRPFAFGCFTAALMIALFGFDFWTDALWATFALVTFAFGMLQQNLERQKNLIGLKV